MSARLPLPAPGQQFVKVSPITAGTITLPETLFVAPADGAAKNSVPSLAFLVTHPNPPPSSFIFNAKDNSPLQDKQFSRPLRILFDLGLRRAADRYLASQQAHIATRAPYDLSPGIAATLRSGGLDPAEDIDAVCLSHVHYDHHGDPEDFPRSTFIVGPGSLRLLREGLQGVASHQHFKPDLLPDEYVVELPMVRRGDEEEVGDGERMLEGRGWEALGPFPNALDLLGDGSVYVVDMPGHLPGHVCMLCRLAAEKWILFAGDTAHDYRLLTGEKGVGTWVDSQGNTMCIHLDKELAEKSIELLRRAMKEEGDRLEIVLAHDFVWKEKHRDAFFPEFLDPSKLGP